MCISGVGYSRQNTVIAVSNCLCVHPILHSVSNSNLQCSVSNRINIQKRLWVLLYGLSSVIGRAYNELMGITFPSFDLLYLTIVTMHVHFFLYRVQCKRNSQVSAGLLRDNNRSWKLLIKNLLTHTGLLYSTSS